MPLFSKFFDYLRAIAILPVLLFVAIYGGIQEYFMTPPNARGLKEASFRRGRMDSPRRH